MARYLPARYQVIRQSSDDPALKMGLLGYVVEFTDRQCVVNCEGNITVHTSLDEVKTAYVTDGASLERID